MPPFPLSLDFLSGIGDALHLGPWVVGLLFLLLLLIWGIYTWVLLYHLFQYGTSRLEILKMRVIYLTGSGILLILLALSFIAYLVALW